MNRRTAIFLVTALLSGIQSAAQTDNSMEQILRQIETNNQELQACYKQIEAQKYANRSDNNLPDPTLSYSHLWDSGESDATVGELIVSQSFDFPTLYALRSQANRQKRDMLDAQANTLRQQILLQAQEICLDIIMLHQVQEILDERLKNVEELSTHYAKRLDTGDANRLELNKIKLEQLNVQTECRQNRSDLYGKLQELSALNGNRPLLPGRPLADHPVPTPQALGLTAYQMTPFPGDFTPVVTELVTSDPSLQSLKKEETAMHKQVTIARHGWLPKLEMGYRRNTESGHPLNGVVVGFSIPLFENRSKVKAARTQAAGIGYQADNQQIILTAELWRLYHEAGQLHASIQDYQQAFDGHHSLDLLKQALAGGEINMSNYFTEVTLIYQSRQHLLQLQNQYQKTMARIYRSRL